MEARASSRQDYLLLRLAVANRYLDMLGDRYYNDTRHVENGDIPTLLINANPLRQNI